MDCISETEVGQSDHLPLLKEVLSGVLLITERAGNTCAEHSLKLFTVVLRLSASKHAQTLGDSVRDLVPFSGLSLVALLNHLGASVGILNLPLK